MGGRGQRTVAPDEILTGHAPVVVALANAARAQILAMIDGVIEEGRPAAKAITFRRREAFAFIAPMADHVRLGFEHGHALPDLAGRLEGEGGQVRYVALRTMDELTSREVKMLISAALFDDDTHGFRSRAPRP
ncbi:MAG TPA: DUF5655 domain-containing protein [Kofleriaceae bacterium]|jgi:hypothetical protein